METELLAIWRLKSQGKLVETQKRLWPWMTLTKKDTNDFLTLTLRLGILKYGFFFKNLKAAKEQVAKLLQLSNQEKQYLRD
jgi:hypothetical protein